MYNKPDRKTLERIELLEQEVRTLKFARGKLVNPVYKFDRRCIVTAEIRSPDFVAGSTGWEINRKGNVEFENGIFRGELSTAVFIKDEIHVHNGKLLITDAAKLGRNLGTSGKHLFISRNVNIFPWTNETTGDEGTATGTTTDKLVDSGGQFETIGVAAGWTVWNTTDQTYAQVDARDSDTTLSLSADIMVSGETYKVGHGPIVAIKANAAIEYLAIASEAQAATDINDVVVKKYGVVRNLDGSGANAWKAGTAVASTKEPGEGWILLDADHATAAPRLEIRVRNNYTWDGWSTRLRLGNLTGVTSTMAGVTPTGYGLYAENVFLKGEIHATNARIYNKLIVGSELGAGIIIGEDVHGMRVNDSRGRPHWLIDNTTGEWRVGYPPDQPAIYMHDGILYIQTRALVLGGDGNIQDFLDHGRLDIMAVGAWDDDDATGLRLEAVAGSVGIMSKQDGTQSVYWDATKGNIKVGEYEQVRFDKIGLVIDSDAAGWQGILWRSDNSSKPQSEIGRMFIEPSGSIVHARLRAYGNNAFRTSRIQLWAEGHGYDESYINITSGSSSPGIFLVPQNNTRVQVTGDMFITKNLSCTGAITGKLYPELWREDRNPPNHMAHHGRMLLQMRVGGTQRIWVGKGVSYGWSYVDLTET